MSAVRRSRATTDEGDPAVYRFKTFAPTLVPVWDAGAETARRSTCVNEAFTSLT